MTDDRPHDKSGYFTSGTNAGARSVISDRKPDAKSEFHEELSKKSSAYGTVAVRTVKKRYAAGKD